MIRRILSPGIRNALRASRTRPTFDYLLACIAISVIAFASFAQL